MVVPLKTSKSRLVTKTKGSFAFRKQFPSWEGWRKATVVLWSRNAEFGVLKDTHVELYKFPF
jgi:hypothetical protein